MASSLRDELASLKIERRDPNFGTVQKRTPRRPQRGGGVGLGLLSMVIWLVPLSLLGAGGYFGFKQYQELKSKPEVSVAKVQTMTSGEAEKLLSAKGYLKSRTQATIGAKVAGRVQELLVEEGSRVKKGQLLAVLEHNDLDAQLGSRQAMLLRAKADIEEAKADLEYKKSKSDRAKRLQNKNMSVSTEELQLATSSVEMGAAHVLSLEATAKLYESQVHEIEESLANMRIVAPFNGTVVERPADLGEMISGPVLTLADLDLMDVETDLSERDLPKVVIGQPAEIYLPAVPDKDSPVGFKCYQGRLRQVIPMSDRARGTVRVKVEILHPDEHLFPELLATVNFLPDKLHKGLDIGKSHLFVPKSAVFEENGHSMVWVVDAKSKIQKIQIDAVVTNDELVQVDSGLKSTDTVVLRPTQALHDGDSVIVDH